MLVIRIDHHGHGVPADDALDAALDVAISRILRLIPGRDGIDVGSVDRSGDVQSGAADPVHQAVQEERGGILALRAQDKAEDFLDGFEIMPAALAVATEGSRLAGGAGFIDFQFVTHKLFRLNDGQHETMIKWCDLTLSSPAENLAADEALLDLCEEAGVEILRFWESRQYFVVVGYGNRLAAEVNLEACQEHKVPVLRRCSGGGTVVQGPGCLNYNLTLRLPETGPLASVTGTNDYIMERHRAALAGLLQVPVAVQGHTDLAFGEAGRWLKFSGNAQRRRRRSLVFHGTLLHQFDLSRIGTLLRFPSAQPDYRAGRPHGDFVRNLPLGPEILRTALCQAWSATQPSEDWPASAIQALCQSQYRNPAWLERR